MSTLLERLNDLRNHYSIIGDQATVEFYNDLILKNTPPPPPPPHTPSTFRPMHWDPNENWNTGHQQNPPAQSQNAPQIQNAPILRRNPPAQSQNAPAQRQNPPAQSQNAPNPLNATAPEFIPQRQGGKSRQHNKINKRVKKSRNNKNKK